MTDTKELILSLSQAIKHSDWGSVSLHVKTAKEIKERLEQQAQGVNEPDEELVEIVYLIGAKAGLILYDPVRGETERIESKAKAEIRKLLQQSKPVVTREEIIKMCDKTFWGYANEEDWITWLKSKGIEVVE